jgi:hypothetical protein
MVNDLFGSSLLVLACLVLACLITLHSASLTFLQVFFCSFCLFCLFSSVSLVPLALHVSLIHIPRKSALSPNQILAMEGSVPLSQPNLGSQLDGVKFDQLKKSPFNERLDKLVGEAIEACRIPGLAIAVVDGETTWKKVHQPSISPFLIDTKGFS